MASAITAARKLGQVAIDLVFPPRCASCGLGGTFLCAACTALMSPAAPPRCERCWRPGVASPCVDCRTEPPAFDGLRAAYVYQGVARELVHALKYRGVTALGTSMAALLAGAVRHAALPVDLIVPVPLSGLRERTRGYNQAAVLARPLGRELGLPVAAGALRRRRHTPPQAGSAGAVERRRNVQGAFEASAGEVAGRSLLLVDDVTTTGATLGACAEAAREAGARSVWALAFARED